MSVVKVDRATGSLVVDGRKVFPLVLSDGPPLGAKAPNGNDALAELAAGGAGFIRTGRHVWSSRSIEQQIAAEREVVDAAAVHGLHCWLRVRHQEDPAARRFTVSIAGCGSATCRTCLQASSRPTSNCSRE